MINSIWSHICIIMEVATARSNRAGDAIFNGKSPLTGQPFLTKSPTVFEDVTTFRAHYTALPLESCRRKPVEPLPPASVIHKNSCYLKMQGSLTQNTYKPPAAHKSKDLEMERVCRKSQIRLQRECLPQIFMIGDWTYHQPGGISPNCAYIAVKVFSLQGCWFWPPWTKGVWSPGYVRV